MRRHELTEEQWTVVSQLIAIAQAGPGRPSLRGDRNFINAVVWIAKTGAPWRDLPERFGAWKTIFNRFSKWAERGLWEAIFKAVACTDDEIGSILDGSIVRAHQDSAGGHAGPKKTLLAARAAVLPPKSTRPRTPKAGRSTSK